MKDLKGLNLCMKIAENKHQLFLGKLHASVKNDFGLKVVVKQYVLNKIEFKQNRNKPSRTEV